MCSVPNMAVFCSSLTSWFPGMSLTYFLNYLKMVPVAPNITGITLVFTFHTRCISIVRSLYFKIFSASLFITFLSPGIATSINMHVIFLLSRIIMSGLLLGIVLSVCTCWFSPISYQVAVFWLSPYLNNILKPLNSALYKHCVQCSLVWPSVVLWQTGDLGATKGSDLIPS